MDATSSSGPANPIDPSSGSSWPDEHSTFFDLRDYSTWAKSGQIEADKIESAYLSNTRTSYAQDFISLGHDTCKRLDYNHIGDVCPCSLCFEKASGLSTGFQFPVEGFGSISQDAQNAFSFQMPPAEDIFGDYAGISSSNNLEFFPPQDIRQKSVIPRPETGRTRPVKRRKLKASSSGNPTTSTPSAERIVGLLTEALSLDDTFSTPEFKLRMLQIKEELLPSEDNTRRHPSPIPPGPLTPLFNSSISTSSMALVRDSFSEERLVPAVSAVSGLTSAQPTTSISSITASQYIHRKHGVSSRSEEHTDAIYQCTYPFCVKIYTSKREWKRHEETVHWEIYKYLCLECDVCIMGEKKGDFLCGFCFDPFTNPQAVRAHVLQCEDARRGGNTFPRKDKLLEHLRRHHDMVKMGKKAADWVYEVDSDWPRQCGFCGIPLHDWERRANHVEKHFSKGLNISDWKIPFPRVRTNGYDRLEKFHDEDDDQDGDDDSDDDDVDHDLDPGFGGLLENGGILSGHHHTSAGTTNNQVRSSIMRWRLRGEPRKTATQSSHENDRNRARSMETFARKPNETFSQIASLIHQSKRLYNEYINESFMPSGNTQRNISPVLEAYLFVQESHERLLLGIGRVPKVACPPDDDFKDTHYSNGQARDNGTSLSARQPEEISMPYIPENARKPRVLGKSETPRLLESPETSNTDSASQNSSSVHSRKTPEDLREDFSCGKRTSIIDRIKPKFQRHCRSQSVSNSTKSASSIGSSLTNSFVFSAASSSPTEAPLISTVNYGYECPCEFGFIGCNLVFNPNQLEAWISHSKSHFVRHLPPLRVMCIFCNTLFESKSDPIRNWRNRMLHIHEHYQSSVSESEMRPDFFVIEYMKAKRLISAEDYKWAIRVTERPSCDSLRPFGYITKAMKLQIERSSRRIHDLRQEDRQRMRLKRQQKEKAVLDGSQIDLGQKSPHESPGNESHGRFSALHPENIATPPEAIYTYNTGKFFETSCSGSNDAIKPIAETACERASNLLPLASFEGLRIPSGNTPVQRSKDTQNISVPLESWVVSHLSVRGRSGSSLLTPSRNSHSSLKGKYPGKVVYHRVPDDESFFITSRTSECVGGIVEVIDHKKVRFDDEEPRASEATAEDYHVSRQRT